MKLIFVFLAIGALLPTGCAVFVGHPDRHDEPAAGVDHGEHPGDLDHGDTMQK